ncbi:MAG: type II toxin-antitoxin system MqsA family antitoxin [Leptospirales bacterium]|nr:type II toxin-antitoxin system MqsA family antitoxin [Leptospirales bacterium]
MKKQSVAESILKGLGEAVQYEAGKKSAGRTVTIKIAPLPKISRQKIKKIRENLHLSQRRFADVLGVSIKTVEAWESGRNKPAGSSIRLLQIIERQPKVVGEFAAAK